MLKKGDLLLIGIILAVAVAGFGLMKLGNAGDGHREAVISQDGEIVQKIDLDSVNESVEITIPGDYTNKLLIENGRIRFVDSDCPNKDCVKTGWISAKGSVAVCLPNKVMIKIEGVNEEIDGGTY